jgi:hypothetical protein
MDIFERWKSELASPKTRVTNSPFQPLEYGTTTIATSQTPKTIGKSIFDTWREELPSLTSQKPVSPFDQLKSSMDYSSAQTAQTAQTATEAEVEKSGFGKFIESSWSAAKLGYLNYSNNLYQWLATQAQIVGQRATEAKENLTKTSLDEEKQAIYDRMKENKYNVMSLEDQARLQEINDEERFNIAVNADAGKDGTWVNRQISKQRVISQQQYEAQEAALAPKINMEEHSKTGQLFLSGLSSLTYSIASLSPTGLIMNFGAQEHDSIVQKYQEKLASGQPLTAADRTNIMAYSAGAAIIEAGTEQIFKFAGMGGKVALKTVGQVAKFIGVEAAQEGIEEVLSYLGAGTLAKITTDKTATWASITDQKALINLRGASENFAAGAMMGGAFSVVTGMKNLRQTKRFMENVKNTPVGDLTDKDYSAFVSAVKQDAKDQKSYEEVMQRVSQAALDLSQNLTAEQQAQVNQNLVNSLTKEVVYGKHTNAENQRYMESINVLNKQTEQLQEQVKTSQKAASVAQKPAKAQGSNIPLSQEQAVKSAPSAVSANEPIYNDVYSELKANETITAPKYRKEMPYFEQVADRLYSANKIDSVDDIRTLGEQMRGVKTKEEATQIYRQWMATDKTTGEVSDNYDSVEESMSAIINSEMPESQAANEVDGIVSKEFRDVQFTKETPTSDNYGISKEAQEAIDNSSSFTSSFGSLKETIANVAAYVKKNMLLGSVTVSNKYGEYKRAIRKFRLAGANAAAMTKWILSDVYGSVKGKDLDLLKKSILYFDRKENADRGLYKKAPLPKGIKSINEIYETEKLLRDAVNKNTAVKEALERRTAMRKKVLNKLIAQGKKVGVDYSHLDQREDYMYNAAIEMYMNSGNKNISKGGLKYKQRSGMANDYISNPVIADYLIMNKMIRDTYKLEVLESMLELNIINKCERDSVTGKLVVPDGYTMTTKKEVMGQLDTDSLVYKTAHEHAVNLLKEMGIDPDSAIGKEIKRKAAYMEIKGAMVIPTEIYENIIEEWMKKKTHSKEYLDVIDLATKKATRMWKWTKIRTPFKVGIYNIRNAWSDLNKVIDFYPRTFLSIPKALSDLTKYYYKNLSKALNMKSTYSNDLVEFMENTGGLAGLTARELGQIERDPVISDLVTGKTTPTKTVVRNVWRMITLENFTDFREQILRYAAYLQLTKDLGKTNGLPKDFLASSREEIKSIKTAKGRAMRMASDILGAYDDTSPVGQMLADHLVPFWRFKGTNIKAYMRGMYNAVYSDPVVQQTAGEFIATKAKQAGRVGRITVLRLGRFVLRIALLGVALDLLNHLWAGDEEDSLPEDIKNQMHLTFPSWITGNKSRVFYLGNFGSFADLMAMIGADYSLTSQTYELMTGKKTVADIIEEMGNTNKSTNALLKTAFSINPLMLESYEVLTGKSGYYYDPESPTEIKDRVKYVFDHAGFGPVYEWISGKPSNTATSWGKMVSSNALKGDVAFWETYDMIDDWYAEQRKNKPGGDPYDKGTVEYDRYIALYYYKLALKLDDKDAMEKYLLQYIANGGTKKFYDASFRTLMPGFNMEKTDKKNFLAGLAEDERKTYDRAVAWYKELYSLSEEGKKEVPKTAVKAKETID